MTGGLWVEIISPKVWKVVDGQWVQLSLAELSLYEVRGGTWTALTNPLTTRQSRSSTP